MKKILSFAFSLILIVGCLAAAPITASAEWYNDGTFEFYILDGEATIRDYKGSDTEVIIPDFCGEYPVVSVYSRAFEGCSDITKVTFGANVKTVGEYVFSNCESLEEILFNDGLEAIGGYVIYDCEKIKNIVVPDSVKGIAKGAFYSTKLESITLPFLGAKQPQNSGEWFSKNFGYIFGSTTNSSSYIPDTLKTVVLTDKCLEIAKEAFNNCNKIESVTINGSITIIGEAAFRDCDSLKNIVIPDSVERIEYEGFRGCISLESVTFGKNIKYIGASAFAGCSSLKDVYYNGSMSDRNNTQILYNPGLTDATWHYADDGDDLTYNFNDADLTATVVGCEASVTTVTIPATKRSGDLTYTVTAIGDEAFANLVDLEEVVIPEGVVRIGNNAFAGCSSLTDITLPLSVNTVGKNAFFAEGGHSYNLTIDYAGSWVNRKNITADEENYYFQMAKWFYDDIEDNVIYEYDESNKTAAVLEVAPFVAHKEIPATVTKDGNTYAVTSIGELAFYNCSNLWKVTIPEGVVSIGESAFAWLGEFETVNLPSTLREIGDDAFIGCKNLTLVNYAGSESGKSNIVIGLNNEYLIDLAWNCQGATPVLNGWVDIDGTWYFYENGTMVTNEWRKDSVGWCYLLEDGRMATNMWLPDSKGWCYIEADGYCATNCWKKDSIGWIWLDGEGSMTKNAWIEDGGKWYYLDSNGYMATSCWMADSVGWVYVGGDGAMLTNSWVRDSVGWCYVGANGYAMTNCWMQDSIGWCYLDAEGRMVTNDKVQDSNGWCYLDANGYWDGKYL